MKVREIFQDKIITVSNLLTVMRIIAAPFLGYFIYKEYQTGDTGYVWYEMGVVVFIIMTDFLDGNLARLMNQVSKLGRFLDPIADKFSGLFAMLFLVLYKGFPLWVLVIALAREVVAVIAGILLYMRNDIQVRPNVFGKMCAVSTALCGALYIISLDYSFMGISLKHFSVFLVLLFYGLGGILYIKTYTRQYLDKKA
ncbi:MAG TPA: CDP-alcohol phosphatidyltransferase family protein [Spirochaetota bacterium]|nr:CDP-alcohol phosphatidyltransferase family protein [Spirochaetota bacterium]